MSGWGEWLEAQGRAMAPSPRRDGEPGAGTGKQEGALRGRKMKGEEGNNWKEAPTKLVRSQLWSQAGLGANPQLGLKVTAPL